MLSLFKIEWMKVKSYRAFWVLLSIFIVLFPATLYFASRIFVDSFGQGVDVIKNFLGNPIAFPRAWLTSGYIGGCFFIILGMLFILLVTNETQYRTHRQNIIDGWSRNDFLKAKLSMGIFLVLISTLLVLISGFWIGKLYTPSDVSPIRGLYFVAYYMVMATMYLMVAMLIAILVKRTGLSIIIYFAVICLDNVVWAYSFSHDNQLCYYFPLEAADGLVANPFRESMIDRRHTSDTTLLTTSLIYITLLGAFITYYFNKIDLKN